MLLRSDNPLEGPDEGANQGRGSSTSHGVDLYQEFASIQDDVERLIAIAAQLFSAIERQIHVIELDLLSKIAEPISMSERTIFKERLIQSAQHLDSSMQEITKHLGQRVLDSTGVVGDPLELVR